MHLFSVSKKEMGKFLLDLSAFYDIIMGPKKIKVICLSPHPHVFCFL